MEIDDYIEVVRREGDALVAAARSAPLDASVPSCPDWDLRELVRHIAGVHHWAARQVGERHADEITGDLVDIVGGWPPDDELVDWAGEQHANLLRVFEDADRDFPYFTWVPGRTPFTMWTRRQAHETSIHRVDAQLAAGTVSPFEPEHAADGVDELVIAMVGSRRKPLPVTATTTLHLKATDIPRTWTVDITPDGLDPYTEARGQPDCTVTGSAGDLYRLVWHRGGDVDVAGEASVLDAWWEYVRPAWS